MQWRYEDSVASWRVVKLLAVTSFDQVIDLVAEGKIESYEWKPSTREDLLGLGRAEFVLRVPEFTFDAFFNAEFGYRGRYAASPAVGEAANRDLIAALGSRLLDYAIGNGELDQAKVAASLAGSGAKAWIDEEEEQVARELIEGVPGIDHARWTSSGNDLTGLVAPVGTRIEIKGAWINAIGDEVTDRTKSRRSHEIYERGHT